MDTTTLSYLAGVIDSDGSISMYPRHPGPSAPHAVSITYYPRVTVSQITTEAIELLHDTFGGFRGLFQPPPLRPGTKSRPQFRWTVEGLAARTTIPQLLPYLRIKRKQAEALMEYYALPKGKPGSVLPMEITQARETIYRRMKELNSYGKGH